MKKNAGRRQSPPMIEDIRASFEEIMNACQERWQEEVMSDAPRWGHVLGVHIRLCELERLEAAAEELLP